MELGFGVRGLLFLASRFLPVPLLAVPRVAGPRAGPEGVKEGAWGNLEGTLAAVGTSVLH